MRHLSVHLPIAFIILLAFILVTAVSSVCLAAKFELDRKKFVQWKKQADSGFSTPDFPGKPDFDRILDEAHTSSEDIPMLATENRNRKRRRHFGTAGNRHRLLRRAADVIKRHFRSKPGADFDFRSLPPSPFMTRRFSLDSIVDLRVRGHVTGLQVKRAAHEKSLRYQVGDFRRKSKRPGSNFFVDFLRTGCY